MREALRRTRVPGVLLMGVLAAASYPWTFTGSLPAAQEIAWKGLGVGLLAVWAAINAKERDGWLLAATLALWAAADVVLELSFVGGAALFAVGHAVVIALFSRNRIAPVMKNVLNWGALLALAIALQVALARLEAPLFWQAAAYAALLLAMALMAQWSRFRLAGWGALLFVASDWLILLRQGSPNPDPPPWIGYAIWWLHFAGVLLIAVSVRAALDESRPAV